MFAAFAAYAAVFARRSSGSEVKLQHAACALARRGGGSDVEFCCTCCFSLPQQPQVQRRSRRAQHPSALDFKMARILCSCGMLSRAAGRLLTPHGLQPGRRSASCWSYTTAARADCPPPRRVHVLQHAAALALRQQLRAARRALWRSDTDAVTVAALTRLYRVR